MNLAIARDFRALAIKGDGCVAEPLFACDFFKHGARVNMYAVTGGKITHQRISGAIGKALGGRDFVLACATHERKNFRQADPVGPLFVDAAFNETARLFEIGGFVICRIHLNSCDFQKGLRKDKGRGSLSRALAICRFLMDAASALAHRLQRNGNALADANAHGGQSALLFALVHFNGRRQRDACT